MSSPGKPEIETRITYQLHFSMKKRKFYYMVMTNYYVDDVLTDTSTKYRYSQFFTTTVEARDCKKRNVLVLTKTHP